jgi:hypothetical protein
VMLGIMYRLAMAERIHLGQPGTHSRNVEEQAMQDAERAEVRRQRWRRRRSCGPAWLCCMHACLPAAPDRLRACVRPPHTRLPARVCPPASHPTACTRVSAASALDEQPCSGPGCIASLRVVG